MIKIIAVADLGPIIEFIVNGVMSVFDAMQDFEFLGTNLLAFCITIMILGVLIPIIFTIGRGFIIPNENRRAKEEYLPQHSHWATQNRWMSRELADSGMKRSWWNNIKHGRSIK